MSEHPSTASLAVEAPPRILAIGFLRLKQLLQEVAPEYAQRARVEVVDRGFEDALVEIEARRAQERVDVLVAAGLHGAFLRRHSDLPVVLVKVGGFDLMHALARARDISPRIALVSFGAISSEVEQFSRGFGLHIVQRSYHSEAEVAHCVQELREAGIDVVVAPGMVLDQAEQAGMRGILLYSHDAVRAAIDDAVEIARAARLASAKRERLNTILEQLRDGVVAVDEAERIEAVNPPMQRLLGRTRAQLLGRVLGDVAPEFTLARTLRDGVEQAEDIVRFGAQTLVISRSPIVERGVRTGAVLTCQDPAAIQRVDRSLRARARPAPTGTRWRLSDLVGQSGAMRRALAQAERFARSEATVLLVGESGTGKELFAQGMHAASRRRAQPFVALNCAAFPESLLESELFGYEEGAFTGARKAGKAGLFEAAHTGTLFLDEIGDMPVSLQTRLLRVLQEREFLRVGATEPTPVDVRVIAATHRDLAARIDAGLFRRDLYYRLNILRLELPSLRERRDDLPALSAHLLERALERARTGVRSRAAAARVAAPDRRRRRLCLARQRARTGKSVRTRGRSRRARRGGYRRLRAGRTVAGADAARAACSGAVRRGARASRRPAGRRRGNDRGGAPCVRHRHPGGAPRRVRARTHRTHPGRVRRQPGAGLRAPGHRTQHTVAQAARGRRTGPGQGLTWRVGRTSDSTALTCGGWAKAHSSACAMSSACSAWMESRRAFICSAGTLWPHSV